MTEHRGDFLAGGKVCVIGAVVTNHDRISGARSEAADDEAEYGLGAQQ
jgi:hypothetical protein